MQTDTFTPPVPVEHLKYGCEDAQSREYDWSRGYGEEWTSYAGEHLDCDNTIECPECDGTGDLDEQGDCPDCDGNGTRICPFDGVALVRSGLIECPECGNEYESDSDAPMMNYFYPLSEYGISEDDAVKLEGLSLCLVRFHESYGDHYDSDDSLPEYALALTGGGMDLSWDIAEGYMRLGYMPPLFTCRLPRFAGTNYTDPRKVWVIEGCKRSAEAVMREGQRALDYLDSLTGQEG